MRKWLLAGLVLTVFVGCAALHQAHEDYQTGKEAPLVAGEVAPAAQAQGVMALMASLPYVGPAAPVLAPVIVAFFAWKRGRRLRRAKGASVSPITGQWGYKVGVESVIQQALNIIKGIFEVGPDGSSFKRAWKVGLSTFLAAVGTGQPLRESALLALAAGTVGGAEKEASKVLVVEKPAV